MSQENVIDVESRKQYRGFARLSPEAVKEIAGKGGRSAHAKDTAHRFSKELAKEAGRKGGLATYANYLARKANEDTGTEAK